MAKYSRIENGIGPEGDGMPCQAIPDTRADKNGISVIICARRTMKWDATARPCHASGGVVGAN